MRKRITAIKTVHAEIPIFHTWPDRLRKRHSVAIIACMKNRLALHAFAILISASALTTLAVAQRPPADRGPARAAPPKSWDNETERLFSTDPLTLLRGERPRAGGSWSSSGGTVTGGTVADTSPSAGSGGGWSRFLSASNLEDEIKSYRLSVAANVKSPGVFNGGGNRNLRNEFGIIAAMFAVAAEFDGTVRWKEEAAGARAAFARAARNAKAADSNTFKESKARSQDLDLLINGEKVEFETPAEDFLWSDVCERRAMMKRLKDAQLERIKPWTANKAEFDRNKDNIRHEAEIIAVLSEIMQKPNFEFHDDDDYIAFCQQLQRHALDTAAAAKDGDLAGAQRAGGEVAKTCDACHEGYR